MGLITVADLVVRGVECQNTERAQAAIEDASAVARLVASPALDDVDSPDTPAGVVVIVVNMVRRQLANPRGLSQETLGDYSYATGGQGVATLLPTARERRLLRRAAGITSTGAVEMQAPLPGPSYDDGITLP